MKDFFIRLVNRIADAPTRAMETTIGFLFMADGLYVMSPVYRVARTSPLLEYAEDIPLQVLTGLSYFLLGAVAFFISYRTGEPRYRRFSAMAIFLAALFSLLFRLGTLGWHPSGWAFNLMVTLSFAFVSLHLNKCWQSSQQPPV